MLTFQKNFIAEAVRRFHMEELPKKADDPILSDIAQRYAKEFYQSPEVKEKYPDQEKRLKQTAIHCYYAGIIVALYELTEEDYKPSEKTFAVLTNMDTVFFSELMFARWNVKKRYANYQTDFMAEALFSLAKEELAKIGGDIADVEVCNRAMTMIFLAAAATDVAELEHPYADTEGLKDVPASTVN